MKGMNAKQKIVCRLGPSNVSLGNTVAPSRFAGFHNHSPLEMENVKTAQDKMATPHPLKTICTNLQARVYMHKNIRSVTVLFRVIEFSKPLH